MYTQLSGIMSHVFVHIYIVLNLVPNSEFVVPGYNWLPSITVYTISITKFNDASAEIDAVVCRPRVLNDVSAKILY